jgi:hypothetical protein
MAGCSSGREGGGTRTARKARPGQVFVVVEYPCHGTGVLVLEHQADAYSLPCGEFTPGQKCRGRPVPAEVRVRLLRHGWEPVPTAQETVA